MDQLLLSYLFRSQECVVCSLSQPKGVRVTHLSLIAKTASQIRLFLSNQCFVGVCSYKDRSKLEKSEHSRCGDDGN